MKFKNKLDKLDWDGRKPCPVALKLYIEALDLYRSNALDSKPITVTSFWREPTKKPSYHPCGQAVDIRTRDMNPLIAKLFLDYSRDLALLFNGGDLKKMRMRIDVVAHEELYGKPQAHYHYEIDDGNPIKFKEA